MEEMPNFEEEQFGNDLNTEGKKTGCFKCRFKRQNTIRG